MSNSTKDELRRQLNLKNLQRHDPSIDRIVASTSYASIYDNKGHGWVKTGVEGPMFLFSRTTAPHYGFFVLNRNGLEYVQEFLTPESEVQVGGEFILYESGKDADRATGIWVFEEKERHELCRQMEQVRARAASSEGAKATAPGLPRGKPISVDMLFSAASPTPAAATLPTQHHQQQQQRPNPAPTTGMNPLDALFASATMSPRPAPAAAQPPPTQSMSSPVPQSASVPQTQRLPATLEQLFAAASPTPQAAQLPTRQQQQQAQSSPPAAGGGGGGGGGMALLDSIFAAAAENSSPRPAAMRAPVPAPAAPYNHHTIPYSSPPQMPSFGSQPAALPTSPPPPPQPQVPPPPPPRDARDLLAMLGGIGSGSGSSGSVSVSSPRAAAAGAQSNGMMTTSTTTTTTTTTSSAPEPGRSSSPVDLATEPHTTVHPQGFSMDVQTGTIAPDLVTSTLPTPTLESDSPLFNNTNSGAPPPPSNSNQKSKAAASTTTSSAATPMFAPPVLSHDIFASLPLPGGTPGGGGGGGRAAVKEELPARRGENNGLESSSASARAPAPAPGPDSRTQAEPDSSAPAKEEEEAPGPTGALSSPSSSMPTTEPQQQQQQQRQAPLPSSSSSSSSSSSILIDKAELVSRVDNILTESGVGMTDHHHPKNGNSDGPMSKEEFVAEALKVIQKPSSWMQLYGRYLERYEEANE